jgi:protein-disulfide isomerase
MNLIFKTISIATLTLTVAACGEAPENSADGWVGGPDPILAEEYTGKDWSKVYSGTDVRDGVVYGTIVVGNPDAAVDIIEYGSLTCSHCANFSNEYSKELKETYVKRGIAKISFKNYLFSAIDISASKMMRCTGPDRAYPVMSLLFERQAEWAYDQSMDTLIAISRRVGVNRAKFDTCMKNKELEKVMAEMTSEASSLGVAGTPTFFVNGNMIDNVRSHWKLSNAVKAAR